MIITTVLFLLFFLYCFSFVNIADILTFGDEAFLLNISRRMIEGELLYRDVKTYLFPGTFYIISLFFKLFGTTLISARIVTSLFVSGSGVLLFKLGEKITANSFFSLVPPVIYIFLIYPRWYITSYYWFSNFFILVSIILMLNYMQRNRIYNLFFSGLSAAISILFVQNKGVFSVISLYLFLFFRPLLTGKDVTKTIKGGQRERLIFIAGTIPVFIYIIIMLFYYSPENMLTETFFWLLSGYVKSTSPFYFYFSKNLMLQNFIASFFSDYPLSLKIIYFLKSFGYFFLGYSYFILFPFIIGYLILFKNKIQKGILESLFLISFTSIVIISSSIVIKSDYHSMLHNVHFSIIALFTFLTTYTAMNSSKKFIDRGIKFLMLFTFVLSTIYGISEIYKTRRYFKYPVETAIGKIYYSDRKTAEEYDNFIQYINFRVQKNETFLCGMWCSYYYLITGKSNPTSFEVIYPGNFPPHIEIQYYDTIINNYDKVLIYDNFFNRAKINPFFYQNLNEDILNIIRNYYKTEMKFEKIGIEILSRVRK